MLRQQPIRFAIFGTLALALALFTGSASAEDTISFQAGSFTPWHGGESGESVAFQYMKKLDRRNYIGFEVEYKDFKGEIWKANDIGLKTIDLRFMYRVDFIPEAIVTPYFGVGFGGNVHFIDDTDKLEQQLAARNPGSTFDADSAGGGIGFIGLFGLAVAPPGADWISIFAEVRAGYDFVFTKIEERDSTAGPFDDLFETDIHPSNHGGISGHGGIRFHF